MVAAVSGMTSFSDVSGLEAVAGKGVKGAEFVAKLTTCMGACAESHRSSPSVETGAPTITGGRGR